MQGDLKRLRCKLWQGTVTRRLCNAAAKCYRRDIDKQLLTYLRQYKQFQRLCNRCAFWQGNFAVA